MPLFSERSLSRLDTAELRLQAIFYRLIETYDCTIVCGHRVAEEQNKAFNSGNSKLQWPDSKHNDLPSRAIDAVPYPTMWDDTLQFYYMAGMVKQIADDMDIKLRWGGDFNRNGNFNDEIFLDLGHWELDE